MMENTCKTSRRSSPKETRKMARESARKSAILVSLFLVGVVAVQGAFTQNREDALEMYRAGNYSRAVEICLAELQERGIDQAKLRMDSYSVLGWSYLRLGQYENALRYARDARSEIRYDIRIIEIQAEAQFYLGRNIEALKLFEEYVSLSPTGDRIDLVYYYMGEIFLRLGEYQHADIAFSTALHHSPQSARWWARLGYAREQIPDNDAAATAYGKALEMEPSMEEARVGLDRLAG